MSRASFHVSVRLTPQSVALHVLCYLIIQLSQERNHNPLLSTSCYTYSHGWCDWVFFIISFKFCEVNLTLIGSWWNAKWTVNTSNSCVLGSNITWGIRKLNSIQHLPKYCYRLQQCINNQPNKSIKTMADKWAGYFCGRWDKIVPLTRGKKNHVCKWIAVI